ncbi:MAG: hypothetical protein CMJ46_11505 [Planctomyces sp.]|nr:hypothetical protein [Planctomyces sp.]
MRSKAFMAGVAKDRWSSLASSYHPQPPAAHTPLLMGRAFVKPPSHQGHQVFLNHETHEIHEKEILHSESETILSSPVMRIDSQLLVTLVAWWLN